MKVVRLRKEPRPEDIKKWTADVYAYKKDNVIFVRHNDRYVFLWFDNAAVGRYSSPDYCPLAKKIYTSGCFNFWDNADVYTPGRFSKIKNFNEIVAAIKKDSEIPVIKADDTKETQLGVELELENRNRDINIEFAKAGIAEDPLIQDVGWDCSVSNGYEYRFNHPNMHGWKISQIKKLLIKLSKKGFNNLYGTAGMHIHVSGTNAAVAARRAKDNLWAIQKILYPISGRRSLVGRPGCKDLGHYGRGSDIIKNQVNYFGTLEFRAFETTIDPYVFYWRLVVCKALFEYLADGKPLEDFFTSLTPKVKQAYKSLLLHPTNPHEYGDKVDVVLNWLN